MKTLWHKFSAYGLFNVPLSEELDFFWIAYVTSSHNPLSWIRFTTLTGDWEQRGFVFVWRRARSLIDLNILLRFVLKKRTGFSSVSFVSRMPEMSAWHWKRWANLRTVSFERRNKTHFPCGQSLSVSFYPQLKYRTNSEKMVCLPRFQGAQPDHLRVTSSSFPTELVRRFWPMTHDTFSSNLIRGCNNIC